MKNELRKTGQRHRFIAWVWNVMWDFLVQRDFAVSRKATFFCLGSKCALKLLYKGREFPENRDLRNIQYIVDKPNLSRYHNDKCADGEEKHFSGCIDAVGLKLFFEIGRQDS